jgi:hypothetical protein
MKTRIHYLISILVVLAMLLAPTQPVFAEEPPPPPPVEDPGGVGVNPAAAVDQPSASEQPAAQDETPAESVAVEVLAPMPNFAPNGAATSGKGTFTGEALLDTNGNPVTAGTDLQSLSISYVAACAAGSLPTWLGGSCTRFFTTLHDAISYASSGWTVWAQPFFYDGLDTEVTKSLTIQGDPLYPLFVGDTPGGFTLGLDIGASNVTLRDIFVNGAVRATHPISGTLRLHNIISNAPNGYSVYVEYFTGSLYLSEIFSVGSLYGAWLDIDNGTGSVNIFNSKFDFTQDGAGLTVAARNKVTLENVSGSGNYLDGAKIFYTTGLTVKNGLFNNNYNSDHVAPPANPDDGYGYGLWAKDIGTTLGPVTISNISANGNDEIGLLLENSGVLNLTNSTFNRNWVEGLAINSGTSGTISLDGVNVLDNNSLNSIGGAWLSSKNAISVANSNFSYNYGNGLMLWGAGGVTLRNLRADNNFLAGVAILNQSSSTLDKPITVLGGYFTNNGLSGLMIENRGDVNVDGVTALSNGWLVDAPGVWIDTCALQSGACTASGAVTISNTYGPNLLMNNHSSGLFIRNNGTVKINQVIAEFNDYTGVEIEGLYSSSDVTITSSSMNYNMPGGAPESVNGLRILSKGNISLDKVSANYNAGSGLVLWNLMASSAKNVTVKNSTTFRNAINGIEIWTKGAVTIDRILAADNQSGGLVIDNSPGTGAVTIQNTLGNSTITGNDYGVYIYTRGSVSITGLNASQNHDGSGLWLEANTGSGTVSVTNSQFNLNNGIGLFVFSKNNITLSGVQANGNESAGASLNISGVAGKSVTVNKSIFSENWVGLSITATGTVTLDNVIANYNDAIGLSISNSDMGAYGVSINSTFGSNMFVGNGSNGMVITTAGSVIISKAMVNDNASAGILINQLGTGKSVTLSCSQVTNNPVGLDLEIYGGSVLVYLKGTSLFMNYGIDLFTSIPALATVSVSRSNCP